VSFDHQGQRITMPLDSGKTRSDDKLGLYEHQMSLYLKAIANFSALGAEQPAFLETSTFNRHDSPRIYAGGNGDDILRGENGKNDRLLGGAGNDLLDGRGGNDKLQGGSGNDILNGNDGFDILTGGDGKDRFIFDSRLQFSNRDTVTDFTPGVDRMMLDDTIFAGLHRGQLAASDFATGIKALDHNDHVIYNPQSGIMYFDVDGAGGTNALAFATLDRGLALTASDIWVV
jgi:Ca2+-binding RTX toxin-like protein